MLEVEIATKAPVSLGTGRGGAFHRESHHYLPGSVVRGALAAAWIREHGLPEAHPHRAVFVELFEQSVSYGPCMTAGSALEPLAVWRCKYRPAVACHTFAVDAAWRPGGHAETCGVCGGPVQAGKGGIVGGLATTDRRGVQLDDQERAEAAKLYSREWLAAGTRFVGFVSEATLSDEAGSWLRKDHDVWLGARRSVAGAARFRAGTGVPPSPQPRDDGLVHVQLDAPAIFVDDATRPLMTFPVDTISALLGADCTMERQWTRLVQVGGWHAASGTAKPTDWAFAAGSAVLLRPADLVTGDQLAALAGHQIGLRKAEGHGWVTVNPPPWQPPAALVSEVDGQVSTAEPVDDATLAFLLSMLPELKQHAQRLELDAPDPDLILQKQSVIRARAGDRQALQRLLALKPGPLRRELGRIESHRRTAGGARS